MSGFSSSRGRGNGSREGRGGSGREDGDRGGSSGFGERDSHGGRGSGRSSGRSSNRGIDELGGGSPRRRDGGPHAPPRGPRSYHQSPPHDFSRSSYRGPPGVLRSGPPPPQGQCQPGEGYRIRGIATAPLNPSYPAPAPAFGTADYIMQRDRENAARQEDKATKDRQMEREHELKMKKIDLEKEKIDLEKEKIDLEKEKVDVEKEKIVLEKEKVDVEKEKIVLEKKWTELRMMELDDTARRERATREDAARRENAIREDAAHRRTNEHQNVRRDIATMYPLGRVSRPQSPQSPRHSDRREYRDRQEHLRSEAPPQYRLQQPPRPPPQQQLSRAPPQQRPLQQPQQVIHTTGWTPHGYRDRPASDFESHETRRFSQQNLSLNTGQMRTNRNWHLANQQQERISEMLAENAAQKAIVEKKVRETEEKEGKKNKRPEQWR